LFATAREKLKPQSTPEEWTPVVAPVCAPIPLSYLDTFDQRKSELKTITSVNRMVYQDVESRNKRDILLKQTSKKDPDVYKEFLAKRGPPDVFNFRRCY
ncbi:hypothetical protein Tco_1373226, partial [Tanacetum coccineum]